MRDFKKQLSRAFDAPSPRRKNEFIIDMNYSSISQFNLVSMHIGYISKRVWIASFLLFMFSVFGINRISNDARFIWYVSSFIPFIALISLIEIMKSNAYSMAELENSTKYNLAHIIIIRLGILGAFNFIVFTIITFVLHQGLNMGFIRLGIYLIVPYIMTSTISIFIINHYKVREVSLICASVAVLVSCINLMVGISYNVYLPQYNGIWLFVFIGITAMFITEITRMEVFKNATNN